MPQITAGQFLTSAADTETQTDSIPSQQQQEKSEKGEKTAENIRYGESISEHGFGGETMGNSGEANQGVSTRYRRQ